MKLKQLLKETKVWERKFGESLPTLEDTTKAYKLKLEQQFKAKSKETGRVVVYKSKDAMDKAIKGGTAEPLDKKTSGKPEKVKGADLFKKIDVVGKDKIELGTKVKDGKIKSSGPQRFADDVKDMKGEYDLDGGVKIKDGKMFNADGEEMDADDIEDFYYQDAYDGKGINVGIDIKKTSEPKKVPPRKGPEGIQGTKDTLAKSLQTGLNPYEHSGLVIQVLDFVGDYPELTDRIEKLNPPTSIGKSDAQYQKELDAFRETENELRNDIIKALSDKSEEPEEPYDLSDFDPREDVKENKMKLKSLLKEAQVWERKFGEPLPTFNSVMEKHSGKKIDEQGVLSRRAGINVFGDRKLQLMTKNLRQTAFDLEKVAKKKDEQAFDDILQRITITIGVIRSFLNKPKRSM